MYEIHFVDEKGFRFLFTPRFKTVKAAQEYLSSKGFEPSPLHVPSDRRYKCTCYVLTFFFPCVPVFTDVATTAYIVNRCYM